MWSRAAACYTGATFAYGFARTVIAVQNADMRVFNHASREFEVRPVLPTEKLAAVFFGVATAPYFTPFRLVWDVYALDLAAHGRYELETGHSSRREYTSVLSIVSD